ncbi:MAG: serine/threonine protein kinase [Gemmataceae bacterium]|nr:serine/threonine protein kinase [Gemmataceae bacterium]MDW8264130.1 serine/threonine-protein kinase [Gemmataceae bacterium]
MAEPRSPSSAPLAEIDRFLLQLLARTNGLNVEKAKAIGRWWLRNRRPDQDLVSFLVHHQVLVAEAAKTLDMIRRGYLHFPDCGRLLTPEALAVIDQHLQPAECDTREEHGDAKKRTQPMPRPVVPAEVAPEPADDQALRRTQAWAAPPPAAPSSGRLDLPRPGMTLGKYLLVGPMGQGATGCVYRARHQTLGIPVAVKVLQAPLFEHDPYLAERLRHEARLLAQLNHPNLVRVWDYDDSGPFPYMVVECVEGVTLAELIEQSGCLRPDRAVRIVLQILDGLACAHRQGIVHRDVKPANVLVSRDGTAKLTDLGLALIVNDALRHSLDSPAAEAGIAGTAAYMAPEQAQDASRVDARTDIYALGATAYHALTGQMPFTGRSPAEVLMKHLHEAPVPPHEREPRIGLELSRVVLTMMAKEPAERYPSCEEAARAMLAAVQPVAAVARPAARSSPGRQPGRWTSEAASRRDKS